MADPHDERPGHDRQPEVDGRCCGRAARSSRPTGWARGRRRRTTIAAVTPRAMPSLRHSPRARNQTSPTPGRDLREEDERPRGRVAEAGDDRGRHEDLDVAERDRRHDRLEQQERQRKAAGGPGQGDEEEHRPDRGEHADRQEPQRGHHLAERGRIEERVVAADVAPAVRIVEPGHVVRLRVLGFGRAAGQLPGGIERANQEHSKDRAVPDEPVAQGRGHRAQGWGVRGRTGIPRQYHGPSIPAASSNSARVWG